MKKPNHKRFVMNHKWKNRAILPIWALICPFSKQWHEKKQGEFDFIDVRQLQTLRSLRPVCGISERG
jgi:hypothetical protein